MKSNRLFAAVLAAIAFAGCVKENQPADQVIPGKDNPAGEIVTLDFTASMEEKLDNVEEGTVKWKDLIKDFYEPFKETLGIAEESDAIALVVSEETGRLSIAVDHELHYNLTLDEFRLMLVEELKPKTEIFYDADEEGNEGEDDE